MFPGPISITLPGDVTSGRVTGDGTFDLRNNTLRASLDFKASSVSTNDLDLSDAELKAQITKLLPAPDQSGTGSDAVPFDGLQTQLDAHVSNIEAAGYAVDSADVAVTTQEGLVRIGNIAVRRADNALSASGTCSLPRDMKSWNAAPATFDFSLDAPSISAFNAEPNLTGPNGKLEAAGTLTNGPDGYEGNITADVSELHMQDFTADGLKLNVSIAKSVASIDTLTFSLNPTDGFSATGHVALQAPYAYDGAVQAQIRDLSKFDALIASLKGGLAGALNLVWHGKGDLSTLRSTGDLQFSLKNGKVQDVQAVNADVSGNYSPEGLNFPTFSVTSSRGNLSAVIAASNDVLRVNQIAVSQGGRPLLTGSLAVPARSSHAGQGRIR
jgi:hypothetical protein